MSLQVWLPLNGDLHNQGLFPLPKAAHNTVAAEFTNDGKLGQQCLNWTEISNIWWKDTTNNELISLFSPGKKYSFASWIKLKGTNTSGNIICLGDITTTVYPSGPKNFGLWWTKATTGSGPRFVINNGDDGSAGFVATSIAVDYINWHHIAYSFDYTDETAIKTVIYIDGQEVARKTYDHTSNNSWNDINTNNINNLIILSPSTAAYNDVRIYDHILSSKEVEEIAKGLVLHYKLDGNIIVPPGYQQLEYLESTGTQSINTGIIPANTHRFNFKYALMEFNGYRGPFGSYGSGESDKCTRIICTNGSSTNVLVYFTSQPSGGASGSSANVNITTATGQIVEGYLAKTGYLLHNLTTNVTQSSNTTFANSGTANNATMRLFGVNTSYSKTRIYYFDTYDNGTCIQKLVPAKRLSDNVLGMYDVITQTFFTNTGTGVFTAGPNASITGTIYDCSGYSNNGTVIGTLTTISPSPRYNIATYGSTDSYISCDQKLILIEPAQFTISFWIKTTIDGYPIVFRHLESNFRAWIKDNTFYFRDADSGHSGSPKTISIGTWRDGNWHHIVIAYDSTVVKSFNNGQKIQEKNVVGPNLTSIYKIYILGHQINDTYSFDGAISDFRFYVTSLSDKAIKELYNTSMSIDSSGNVYARELVELV